MMDFDEIVANAIPYKDNFKEGDTLTITEWCALQVAWSKRMGFRDFKNELLNFHSEVSEMWEEERNGKGIREIYYNWDLCNCGVPIDHVMTRELHTPGCPATKPEGIPIEMADLMLRIVETCGYYKIDLEAMMKLKMRYNETREYRHGGKKA